MQVTLHEEVIYFHLSTLLDKSLTKWLKSLTLHVPIYVGVNVESEQINLKQINFHYLYNK